MVVSRVVFLLPALCSSFNFPGGAEEIDCQSYLGIEDNFVQCHKKLLDSCKVTRGFLRQRPDFCTHFITKICTDYCPTCDICEDGAIKKRYDDHHECAKLRDLNKCNPALGSNNKYTCSYGEYTDSCGYLEIGVCTAHGEFSISTPQCQHNGDGGGLIGIRRAGIRRAIQGTPLKRKRTGVSNVNLN